MIGPMGLDLSQLPHAEIEALCREYHIHRLALFGSALRDDFTADSDVDVLVEFEPDARIGLAFFRLQDELSELFGQNVDLHTPQSLSKYFRDEVLSEARDIYVAA